MKKRIAPIKIDPNDRLPGTGTKSTPSSDDIWAAMRKFVDEHGHQFGKDPTSTLTDIFGESDFIDKFTRSDNSSGNFDDIMRDFYDRTGHSGETDIDQLLAAFFQSYFTQGGNSVTTERNDMLLQFLLQILSSKDQRAFDISQLEDSRLYSSPTNELARLMAAGIGRDAAIQILSGSAGGNSVGVAGSAGSAPGVSAPSGTMDLQQKQFAVGTAQAAVQMLSSLVDTGMSLAQGVQSVQSLQAQNYLTQQQLQGYDSANKLAQAVQLLQTNGTLDPDDLRQMSNGQDLLDYLSKQSANNATVAQLVQSAPYTGVAGSVYGREFFNNYWDSIRKSRDAGTIADNFLSNQRLNNALSEINIQKVGAEMSLIGAQENEIDQRIIESSYRIAQINADIQYKNIEGKWIKVQTDNYGRLVDSQVNLMDTQAFMTDLQATGQRIQNDINADIFEVNHAGFPMMKQSHIIQCEQELAKLRLINDPEGRKKQLQLWAQEQDNAIKLAYLNNIYYGAVGDFATNYPSLFALANGFNACGAGDVIRSGSGVVNTAAKAFRFMPK